jgi:hypothetical protein
VIANGHEKYGQKAKFPSTNQYIEITEHKGLGECD